MSIYKEIMKDIREFTKNIDNAVADYSTAKKELIEQKLEDAEYDEKILYLRDVRDTLFRSLADKLGAKLYNLSWELNSTIGRYIYKDSTPEFKQIISKLEAESKVTAKQIEQAEQVMKDCPMALRQLKLIALKNNVPLTVHTAQEIENATDIINPLQKYVENYRGDEFTNDKETLEMRDKYFNTDLDEQETEQKFWMDIVGMLEPSVFDVR